MPRLFAHFVPMSVVYTHMGENVSVKSPLRPSARFASASTSWQAGVVPVKDNNHNEGIIE